MHDTIDMFKIEIPPDDAAAMSAVLCHRMQPRCWSPSAASVL